MVNPFCHLFILKGPISNPLDVIYVFALSQVVVKKMRAGEKLAEYFDCVTVFFSTVVEFQVCWTSSNSVQ